MSAQALGKVAVLLGGNSAEREISLLSGHAILNAMLQQGVNAVAFDPKEESLATLTSQGFDRVFIALHGRGGEDGTVQGALEFMGIPYTGSRVQGAALAMDKARTKYIFDAIGLPTSPYVVVCRDEFETIDAAAILKKFDGAVIVKPVNEGSSIGMSKAESAEQLVSALKTAFEYDNEVVVERWITGREFTVAVLGDEALPVVEMKTPRSFYDYEAKYKTSSTQYYCPCDISESLSKRMQETALKAFKAVGAFGWGRVDIMTDEQENLYLLEVNTVPGMTEKSLVPMAAKATGLSFEQLVMKIIESTL